MQASSPLAALQPRPFITTTFGMSPYSRPRARPNSLQSRLGGNISINESGFLEADGPVADSSPTTSLVADLSQNFHIDKTPRVATPRRSLFSNFTFVGRGMPSSPLMGAIDAGDVDEMDLCSLPHKPSFISPISEEPAISPHTEYMDSPMRSSPPPEDNEPIDELPAAPQVPGAPSKRAVLLERRKSAPTRQPFRHKSSNVLFKHTAPTSSITFPGLKGSKMAPLDLGEMFGPSPPQKERGLFGTAKSGFNAAVTAPPPRPKFASKDTSGLSGSPVAPVSRRPPPRPKQKIRRTMSMYTDPEEVIGAAEVKKATTTTITKPLLAPQQVMDSPSKFGEPQHVLPCFQIKDNPLRRIKRQTLLDVLDDKYKDFYDSRVIVDCRFEYEYDGGHVDGAINVNSIEALEETFFKNPVQGKVLVIFHCEYSAHRAPRMASHFRSRDRQLNMHRYPTLSYPDVYILDGGYSGFYSEYKERCVPQHYIEMNDALHRSACEREMGRFRRNAKLGRAQTFTFGVHNDREGLPAASPIPRRNFAAPPQGREERRGGGGGGLGGDLGASLGAGFGGAVSSAGMGGFLRRPAGMGGSGLLEEKDRSQAQSQKKQQQQQQQQKEQKEQQPMSSSSEFEASMMSLDSVPSSSSAALRGTSSSAEKPQRQKGDNRRVASY